jgi:hypothetical protein
MSFKVAPVRGLARISRLAYLVAWAKIRPIRTVLGLIHEEGGKEWNQSAVVLRAIPSLQTP